MLDKKARSIEFKWDFFERAVNNYSFLIRLMNAFDKGENLLEDAPYLFLDALPFEACKIVIEDEKNRGYNFLSLDETPDSIELDAIRNIYKENYSPYLLSDVFGYSLVYTYPLCNRRSEIIGYLILATKRKWVVSDSFLKELKLLCNIFNKLILLSNNTEMDYEGNSKEMLHKNTIDFFPEPIFFIDDLHFIQYANKKAQEEFFMDGQLLIGEKFENVFKVNPLILENKFTSEGKVEFIFKDTYKIFNLKSFPVFQKEKDGEGRIKCLILEDISQEKIRDAYISHLKNMESMGLLAGGIAHDFNNILTGILGYASLMKNFLDKESRLLKYTIAIEHAAQRAANLTRHLLGFAKRQIRKNHIVDINAIIEDLALIFKESYRDITIEKNLSKMLPPVKSDEGEVQNILLNILLNAKDALDGKGTIKITTDYKELKNKKGFVLVEIKDNGPGIAKDIINKVFEPYFTTREDRHRFGLGLFIAKRLAKNNGGTIEIDSAPNEGTKITVYLPVAHEGMKSTHSENDINLDNLNLNLNVLIVDDEGFIRDLLKGVLKSAGCQIIEAKDGDEAVDLFKRYGDNLDLVILDMIMPGKKGHEVLKEIINLKNDVKIIISSGFMNEKQKESLKGFHIDAFLDKPYTARTLLNTVKKIYSL